MDLDFPDDPILQGDLTNSYVNLLSASPTKWPNIIK